MHKNIRNIYLLSVITPIMLLVIWLFAIRKTIDLNKELSQTQEKLENLSQAPNQVLILQSKLEQIDKFIGNSSQNIGGDEIFKIISEYSTDKSKIQIIDFPVNTVFSNNNYLTNTYTIKVKGKYSELLKMLNAFENNKSIGKIVSIEFIVETNLKTKKKSLMLILFVQTYNKLKP